MEIQKIKLMRHHLPVVMDILKEEEIKLDRFGEWISDKFYEKKFNDATKNWVKNLNPKETIIELVDDKAIHFDRKVVNVDDICKLGCPYYVDCDTSVNKRFLRMFIEKWYLTPFILMGMLSNHEDGEKLKEVIPNGEYILEDLVGKYRLILES